MNLSEAYETAVISGKIKPDSAQQALLPFFQELMDALHNPPKTWFKWRQHPTKGIYLYGSVGAGKTYLMDLFYHHLHLHGRGKLRLHFHHFMQQIDGQLRRLQGQKNPLQQIAKQMAATTRVLCLDEMLVNDIAHAMILAELFQHLFKENIILVSTSNTAPDDLYRNGVQRQRFLPAIQAIKTQCRILSLITDNDFRIDRTPAYQTYIYPLNSNNEAILEQQFRFFGDAIEENGEILIQNRKIPYRKRSDKAIWFDFDVICNLPRSQLDYLEIVQHFHTIIVSNIPIFDSIDSAKAVLFVNFIDVLYDQKIALILSAALPLDQLFSTLTASFQRTYSRLQEMQSNDYLF